jgi:Na+/H+ antiporter NhaD/arsenite permease-like protein
VHQLTPGNPAHVATFVAQHPEFRLAISVAPVFFGTNTCIGNGPNFMVKSIAEHAGVACPTVFGYNFKDSVPVLIPVFALVWCLSFR